MAGKKIKRKEGRGNLLFKAKFWFANEVK